MNRPSLPRSDSTPGVGIGVGAGVGLGDGEGVGVGEGVAAGAGLRDGGTAATGVGVAACRASDPAIATATTERDERPGGQRKPGSATHRLPGAPRIGHGRTLPPRTAPNPPYDGPAGAWFAGPGHHSQEARRDPERAGDGGLVRSEVAPSPAMAGRWGRGRGGTGSHGVGLDRLPGTRDVSPVPHDPRTSS